MIALNQRNGACVVIVLSIATHNSTICIEALGSSSSAMTLSMSYHEVLACNWNTGLFREPLVICKVKCAITGKLFTLVELSATRRGLGLNVNPLLHRKHAYSCVVATYVGSLYHRNDESGLLLCGLANHERCCTGYNIIVQFMAT